MKTLGKKIHTMKETVEAYCGCGYSQCSCNGCPSGPNPGSYDASQWYSPYMTVYNSQS